MKVEALSNPERDTLASHPACRVSGPKALRIIDALTKALASAEAQRDDWRAAVLRGRSAPQG